MNRLHDIFTVFCIIFLSFSNFFGMNHASLNPIDIQKYKRLFENICHTEFFYTSQEDPNDRELDRTDLKNALITARTILKKNPTHEIAFLDLPLKENKRLIHFLTIFTTYTGWNDEIDELWKMIGPIFNTPSINIPDDAGNTPLMYAFQNLHTNIDSFCPVIFYGKCNLEVFLVLLTKGANPTIKNKDGISPAMAIQFCDEHTKKLTLFEKSLIQTIRTLCKVEK